RRTLSLIAAGAALLVVAQLLAAGIQLVTLQDEMGWPIQAALATAYYQASAVKVVISAALGAAALALRRRRSPGAWPVLVGLSVVLPLVGAGTSHAAARLEHRGALYGLDALHQFATAVWVGGLLNLVAAAARCGDRPWPEALLRRFSAISLTAV